MVRLGDAVYVAAAGFLETSDPEHEFVTEAYAIRGPEMYQGRVHVWIAVTKKVPVIRLWGSFPMKLYYTQGKQPFQAGINYAEYDFEGDQLFYLMPVFNLHLLDKPSLTQEQLTQYDNKLEVAEKLNLRKKAKHRDYVVALAKNMANQQGYWWLPGAPPVAEAEDPPAGPPANNQVENEDPQGGGKRKSRRFKKSKSSKKTRKH